MNAEFEGRGRGGLRRGHAAVEATLMAPWILLLFIAVMDFGFYAYAAIATANAARIGALKASMDLAYHPPGDPIPANYANDLSQRVLAEMAALPNVQELFSQSPPYTFPPLGVDVAIDGATTDGQPAAVVTVRYRTVPMFPLPWMTGQFELTRIARMRMRR